MEITQEIRILISGLKKRKRSLSRFWSHQKKKASLCLCSRLTRPPARSGGAGGAGPRRGRRDSDVEGGLLGEVWQPPLSSKSRRSCHPHPQVLWHTCLFWAGSGCSVHPGDRMANSCPGLACPGVSRKGSLRFPGKACMPCNAFLVQPDSWDPTAAERGTRWDLHSQIAWLAHCIRDEEVGQLGGKKFGFGGQAGTALVCQGWVPEFPDVARLEGRVCRPSGSSEPGSPARDFQRQLATPSDQNFYSKQERK